MLLILSLTQFMGAVTILLVKIAFKTYLSSLSLILTMANSKRTVYMCLSKAAQVFSYNIVIITRHTDKFKMASFPPIPQVRINNF